MCVTVDITFDSYDVYVPKFVVGADKIFKIRRSYLCHDIRNKIIDVTFYVKSELQYAIILEKFH